jgi:CBS domain containing-hemolysin-like protein
LQALPIFLDSLVPSFGAILISVTLILAFGEVIHLSISLNLLPIPHSENSRVFFPLLLFLTWLEQLNYLQSQIMPQAICTRYGLSMGAKAAPIVRVLLVLFFPVAYPISKVRRVLKCYSNLQQFGSNCQLFLCLQQVGLRNYSLINLPTQGDLLVMCSSSHPNFQTT